MRTMRTSLITLALATLLGCATGGGTPPVCNPCPTPTVTPPPPAGVSVLTVRVTGPTIAFVMVNDREWSTRPDGIIQEEFKPGQVLIITARAEGYVTSPPLQVTATAGHMPEVPITLAKVPYVIRTGPVRLDRRVWVDDQGPMNGLGLTLFWALWGEMNDQERLDRNLKYLADEGADYVRILGMIGGTSWEDRTIDPRHPDYWPAVTRLAERAKRYGLRLQVTVFAGAQNMPDQGDRDTFSDQWTTRVNQTPDRFTFLECCNEAWQNGFEPDQLVRTTRRLNDRTSVLVAPSALSCGTFPEVADTPEARACVEEWNAILAVADLATPHFDRDISKADGPDRPIRQPWEMLFNPFKAYVNNEPIGPQSSVAEENDPQRLMLAAVTTWIAGGASYNLHAGAGVRGGGAADLARGRSANFWEVPGLTEALRKIAAVRKRLPAGLANCAPSNAHWDSAVLSPVDADHLVRAYQTVCPDGTFVAVPHGLKRDTVELTARRTLELDGVVYQAGERVKVKAPSAVLIGRVR